VILIYAFGSGLGHLKRVTSFLCQEKYNLADCIILTNSSYFDFWDKTMNTIKKDENFFSSAEFTPFLEQLISEKNIHTIIVDVFPSGFFGEFYSIISNFKGEKILLSRILLDDYFLKMNKIPLYDRVYLMENGIDISKLKASKFIEYQLQETIIQKENQHINSPYFLIIHSQPLSEILYLYKLALMHKTTQKIVVFSTVEIPEDTFTSETIVFFNEIPSDKIIEGAEKIFTAAGFNIVNRLKPYQVKWICTPFPRTYDNQFLRKELLFSNK
jgi:hypothetical protein